MKRTQLTTSKGGLTNACIIETIDGKELPFSYQTLVGVWVNGIHYYQRDGLAGSRTTGKHINLWVG